MKRIVILLIVALLGQWMYAKDYQVSGPQGGLAMTLTLPDGFDTATDSCPLVILMHGIFSSKKTRKVAELVTAFFDTHR